MQKNFTNILIILGEFIELSVAKPGDTKNSNEKRTQELAS